MADDIQKVLLAQRRKLIASIRKLFTPHFYESGYRKGRVGESRPLLLWCPRDSAGKTKEVTFDGYRLTNLVAVTEEGVMVDAYGAGAVTEPLRDFPLEDLMMLYKWGCAYLEKQNGNKTN